MTLKIALNSVLRGIGSWVALIVTSVALCVVLTLNIGLVVAGTATEGEAQQAYVAMGGVALGFSGLTGLASFILVVGICVRLQHRDVALWQVVGVLPRTAFSIMLLEVLVVSAVSAAIGAAVSVFVWPAYANFVGASRLPYSGVLDHRVPVPALITGIATTAVVSIVAGLRSSRKVVRGNLIEGVKSSSLFLAHPGSSLLRIIAVVVGILLLVGVGVIYSAIGRGQPITDPQAMGDFLTTYPGMGILLCLLFAVLGGPIIQGLIQILKMIPGGGIAKFLASRESAARPRLTQALIIPISLAAAAVGVMVAWVRKLQDILTIQSGQENTVSAPPEQMALLLGGPVIVACIAAAAIVFATAQNRQEDNALLLISGSTPATIYAKVIIETIIYAVIALVCAYLIVGVNEIAMVAALSAGPIPSAGLAFPGWASAGVVAFGILLTLIMLLTITFLGTKKQSLSIVLRGN